jgi:glycosyltransferase involved in cell wall biosynthesis
VKILHIGKYYPPVAGGMERFLADLVKAQRAAGDEVTVLVHSDGRAPRDDPAWLMRCPVWFRLIFAPVSPAFPFWFARALREHAPDVIHIHMPNPSAFWALLLPAARKRPWVVHWHADVESSKISLRMAYPHYRIFERALLERAEAIIATSRRYLESSVPLRAWLSKCHVIPLGVDPQRLPDVAPGAGDALWGGPGLRILAVGRLTYYKGFDTLVRALVHHGDKRLVVVGEGEERRSIERILAEAGNPPAVRLAGEVDDATLHTLLASCDVLCLPSRERTEAFGLVLVEAMRYSKPLVVGDVPGSGMSWVARPGQNAALVAPEDAGAWSEALIALAAHPEQRELMGRLGRERYQREFDIGIVASRVGWVYALAAKLKAKDDAPLRGRGAVKHVAPRPPAARGVLVVIPALNEADCIGEVIRNVRAQGNIDILVVDDGSSDDTAAIARLGGAQVTRAPLWQGAWGAIQTGIRYALRHGYTAVVTMDADGQHEPAYLPQLIEAAEGADVVIAACASRGSALRHLAWSYFRLLTGLRFDDLTSGFRYYNARACRLLASPEATLLDYQDIGVLMLLRRAGLAIAEVSVAMNPRRSGASRVFFSWWTVARYMAETTLLCLARWKPARK